MNADEITRAVLEHYEQKTDRSLKARGNCIWALAMRLMEAGEPDAPERVGAVGAKLELSDHEIERTIRNAAKRTGWEAPKVVTGDAKPSGNPDITEPGTTKVAKHTARAYLGDCPACSAMMPAYTSPQPLMEIHAAVNGMTFDEMWGSAGDVWDAPSWEDRNRPAKCEPPAVHCLHDPMCACAGNGWCGCSECKRMDEWQKHHEYDQRWQYYVSADDCDYDREFHCWVKKSS